MRGVPPCIPVIIKIYVHQMRSMLLVQRARPLRQIKLLPGLNLLVLGGRFLLALVDIRSLA